MKQIIATLLLALPIITMAQSPQKMNYQGVARDGGGIALASQSISLRLSILSGSVSGNTEYSETQSATTSDLGLFSIEVGGGSLLSGSFASIDWGSESHFVKVEMDPAGGTAYQLMGTSQLLSVPYALYAETSGSSAANEIYVFEESYAAFTNAPNIIPNSWYTRVLNTTAASTGTSISRSGNVISIDSIGTYYVEASCPIFPDVLSGTHQGRLRNTTASSTDVMGNSATLFVSSDIKGVLEVTSVPVTYEIQHRAQVGGTYGQASNSVEAEVYTRVVIEKID